MKLRKSEHMTGVVHLVLMTWTSCWWPQAATEASRSSLASPQRRNDKFSGGYTFHCPQGKRCNDLSVSRKGDTDDTYDYVYASSSSCLVESLYFSTPTLLHSSIGTYCDQLMSITLEGGGWDCSWDGWKWLKEWHESGLGVLHQPTLNCRDVSPNCSNTDGEFSTGLHYQQVCMKGEKDCGPCQCSFTYDAMLSPPAFISTVDCTARNLSDETVPPHLPLSADFLAFGGNRLKTADSLMRQAARMPHLRAIYLNDNLLTALPDIGHISSIGYIVLENNSIEQVMTGNFSAYLERSDDLSIRIKNNPLKCGCEFYMIDKMLRERRRKKNVLQFIEDFLGIECPDGPLPKLYHDESCPDYVAERHNSSNMALNFAIGIMGVLNVFLIYLNFDLQKAICDLRRGYNEPYEPLLHRICSAVCKCCGRMRDAVYTPRSSRVPQEGLYSNRVEHRSFASKSMVSNSNDR